MYCRNSICLVLIQAKGPEYTYLWTTNDGNIISDETTLSPLVNEPGTYTLSVLNTINGCESFSSVVVGVDSNVPIANAGPNETLTCTVSQITLNGTRLQLGGELYLFLDDGRREYRFRSEYPHPPR